MTFSDKLQHQQKEEDDLLAEWSMGEYVADKCPNCGRLRLCKCDNGKHRCEKCNWVVEDNMYCSIRYSLN